MATGERTIEGTGMKMVSVVIPCFNGGQHLAEAVQSALAQTYTDLEIVIVDDGSTDPATLALLDHATWPHTRVFRQANAGPAAARNRAIREAHGDYILPLDADDTIEPTYVEKAMDVLATRPEVGCVYCRAMKFGAENGPWDLPPYTLNELAIDNIIFVTTLFRKSDWKEIGGFDEALRNGVEDYDFWVKMVAAGKGVVQLDEYLFNYRVQDESRTTRFQDRMDSKVASYARIFRNNQDFYVKHIELLFKHRFDLYAQVDDWHRRYDQLEAEKRGQVEDWQRRYQELEAESNTNCAYWQERYGKLDAFLERHVTVRKIAGHLKKLL